MNEEKLLKAIENDARFDLNDLAKELDADVETLRATIKDLEKRKVICGYHTIINYDKTNGEVIVEQRNYFKPGDVVEIFGPNIETVTLTIPKIYDMDGNLLDVARHPKQLIKFKCEIPLSKMDIMRIKVFDI